MYLGRLHHEEGGGMQPRGIAWEFLLFCAMFPLLGLRGGCEEPSWKVVEPIYLVHSYHLDPIGTTPQSGPTVYAQHRDAVLWLEDLAQQSGMRINAFSTGLYAEGAVRSGDFSDFADFMPGGPHTLGVHLHAHHKPFDAPDAPWTWVEESPNVADPDIVRAIYEDQIFFVNELFRRNGVDPIENIIMHGSHVQLDDMSELYGTSETRSVDYPNVFTLLEGRRGIYHPYRGPASTVTGHEDPSEDEDFSAPYVHIPIVSGVIGYDEVHGPEGMVYGTVPYIKRDFILEYLEWREVERGASEEPPRIWVFGWGSHPYQTTAQSRGTDGRLVRDSWREIVSWLNEHYVEKKTPHGNEIARWANDREVEARFLEWEEAHPGVTSIDHNEEGGPRQELAFLFEPLGDAAHDGEVGDLPEGVRGERFRDSAGAFLWLLWSDVGSVVVPVGDELPFSRTVRHADGTTTSEHGETILVGETPILVFEDGSTS
ncbi:MAG: hypothetical protein D6812_14815 [Deltaproteobacteria bacterium]|nr:MAG: hypothetical protein D6812_14815 [Deltaproteobacteria bacterium]